MTIDQILALVFSGESETLELKETTGMRREAAMMVCAFPEPARRASVGELLKALPHKLMTGEMRVREFELTTLGKLND